jgi:hypothetical protein
MKKLILLILLICSPVFFPHGQTMHQYIVREAFKLLIKSYPILANSEMATYIGFNETSNSIDKSWGAGKIVSGAWIEDEYDIVYHYGIGNIPNFNQWTSNLYANLFNGGNREAFTSITHFWDADGGLNKTTDLSDNASGIYWSFSCENAMQKMNKYFNGDFDNRYMYVHAVYWAGCESQISLANDMKMYNLFELYKKTKQVSCVRYLDISLDWVPTDCPIWDYPTPFVYEQLGRMCHLLGDMSVPAHVHCNSHACTKGMYCDEYENNASTYHLWTADEIYAQDKTYIDPYNSWSTPLYYLMYFMNQITDHYASGKTNGDNNYDANCPGLSEIYPSLGLPVYTDQINQTNLSSMHDALLPLAIRATAGLLYWFAKEANILPPPPLSATISGPSTAPCATGTWSANVSGGYPPYTYQWYQMYASGGGLESSLQKGTIAIQPYKQIDTWYPVGNTSTLNYYLCGGNSYIRVDVKDSHNTLKSVQQYVAGANGGGGGGVLPKAEANNSTTLSKADLEIPKEYNLEQNYPNPFNPSTIISYSIKTEGRVSLKIYNTLGQEIRTLVDEIKPAGNYEVEFYASELPSGIYIYRM